MCALQVLACGLKEEKRGATFIQGTLSRDGNGERKDRQGVEEGDMKGGEEGRKRGGQENRGAQTIGQEMSGRWGVNCIST